MICILLKKYTYHLGLKKSLREMTRSDIGSHEAEEKFNL